MWHQLSKISYAKCMRLFALIVIVGLMFMFMKRGSVYDRIADIRHPTEKDYQRVQAYLKKGKRPGLELLKDMEKRCRSVKIVSKRRSPESGLVHVNGGGENCVIAYATLNRNYPGGLKRLVDHISQSDFRGDVLFRVGGWPNVEEGDLTLAHVPYAFKACFFREAKRLGYKRVLWLDTSIVPIVSLNRIFNEIEKKGYFLMGNQCMIAPYFNELAAKALGVTMEEAEQIPSCSSGLFGLDFSNEKALQALQGWYEAAKDPHAYYSARSDQNALSVILYKLGMRDWASLSTLAEGQVSSESLFLIDRVFVRRKEAK